jgi:CBS domain containing-hemolysin-like protein
MVIASFLSPEAEDTLATWLALFVIFVVPVVLIALFWMVHILPEKIAHKRHHPQFEAIRTLCLLSLVFGGLLWPIAWLWAYSKPVVHKMAYGTDKASHDVDEEGSAWDEEATLAAGAKPTAPPGLHDRLAQLEARVSPDDLKTIRGDIEAIEAKLARIK